MIRVIVFLIVVAAVALAAAWLAERPGDIIVTWMGWRIETSLMVGLAALAILVLLLMGLWSLARLLWRSPRMVARLRRERRQRRGERAISRGLVAVASGDLKLARRSAGEAGRFAADEPLGLLLRAQTAQLAGDRAQADAAFRAMTEHPETRVLGLRGLYVEAQRRGDVESGRRHAEEAARAAPALSWAGQAVLDFRCAAGDWDGALAALENSLRGGLVDRPSYRRQRAVLLTARALASEEADPASARTVALEAARLAPGLVPAVALAARLAAEAGEYRRASRLIEAAWPLGPHPDLAEVYVHQRSGDSARERLGRAQTLDRLASGDREGALAVARAAIEAREFAVARAALAGLLDRPTQRVAMLMAELEETENEDSGRAREWMARALRTGGDPRWTADGAVFDRWMPLSPVSGRLDAVIWAVPPGETMVRGLTLESRAPEAALPRAIDAPAAVLPVAVASDAASTVASPAPAPEVKAPAAASAEAPVPEPKPSPGPVSPLVHAPDDPGPEPEDFGQRVVLRRPGGGSP